MSDVLHVYQPITLRLTSRRRQGKPCAWATAGAFVLSLPGGLGVQRQEKGD